MTSGAPPSLKILHVLRAPVGGLFRHVVDLARGQASRGHRVGLIADATTGGPRAEAILAELAPELALGLTRVAMSRHVGAGDLQAVAHVGRRVAALEADVVHGHGAKGGAYARLASGGRTAIRAYTPHGGSLHFRWGTPAGFLYLALERALMRRTDLFLFESAYGRDAFFAKVGKPDALTRVVHNGVGPAEFAPISTDPKATDTVFVGELRRLKGVDVLIEAIAALTRQGKPVTATIVGEGPDHAALEALVAKLQLGEAIRFAGAIPARSAFVLGQVLAVPSRAESLPYIVLEAAAAGLPMVATRVGEIPEVFGANSSVLVPPDDSDALARAIEKILHDPVGARDAAKRLQARVRANFSIDSMTDAVLAAYRDALTLRAS